MLLRTSLMRSCGLMSGKAANSTRRISTSPHSFSVNPLLKTFAKADASCHNSPLELGSVRSISVTPDTAMKYLEKDKHSHTKEWMWERGTSVALLLCFPAAFVVPLPIVDFTFTTLGVFHGHLGMEAVFADYIHSHNLRKLFSTLLYLSSFLLWGSLMYFNYTDVGICKGLKLIWSL